MPCLDTWLRAVDRAFQPAPQVYASGISGLFWQLGQHSATQHSFLAWPRMDEVGMCLPNEAKNFVRW